MPNAEDGDPLSAIAEVDIEGSRGEGHQEGM